MAVIIVTLRCCAESAAGIRYVHHMRLLSGMCIDAGCVCAVRLKGDIDAVK